MARRRARTDEILVVHTLRPHFANAPGVDGETPLDHRARLRRTETGTGTRPLRRTWLARLPSSRHALLGSVWVPNCRAEPFFPLCACRPDGTIRPGPPGRLPATRPRYPHADGIIPARLPRCAVRLPAFSYGISPDALFAERFVYNTVVLAACV